MNKDREKKQKVKLKRAQEEDQERKKPVVLVMGEKSPRIRGLNLEKILGKQKKINDREELRSGSLSISLFDDDGEDVMKNVDVGILDVGAAEKVNIKKNKMNEMNNAKKNGKQVEEDDAVSENNVSEKNNASDKDEGKDIKKWKNVKATHSVRIKKTVPGEEGRKVEKPKQKTKPEFKSATKSITKSAKKRDTKSGTKSDTKLVTKSATKPETKSASKLAPKPTIDNTTKVRAKQKMKREVKSKSIEFSLIDALKIDQSSTSSIEDSDEDVFSLDSPVKKGKSTTTKKNVKRKPAITTKPTLKKRKIQFPVSQLTSIQQSVSSRVKPQVETLAQKAGTPTTRTKVPLKPSTPSPRCTITTKIPLNDHTSATPINRRLSLSSRGKRLSSIGNGFIATPHKDIPVDKLHEHLEMELPDPYKIKQLLIWCCRRIRPGSEDQSEASMVNYLEKLIIDEFIDELINGDVNISWWENDDDNDDDDDDYHNDDDTDVDKSDRPIVVKENSANVNNSKKLQIFERKVRELEKEEYLWNTFDDNIKVQKYVDELIDIELQDVFNTKSDLNDESDRIFNNILELENTVHKLKISNELIGKLVNYKNETIADNLKKREKGNNNVIKLLGKLY